MLSCPTRLPRNQPFSIGPPVTTIKGRSVDAAISSEGAVLRPSKRLAAKPWFFILLR